MMVDDVEAVYADWLAGATFDALAVKYGLDRIETRKMIFAEQIRRGDGSSPAAASTAGAGPVLTGEVVPADVAARGRRSGAVSARDRQIIQAWLDGAEKRDLAVEWGIGVERVRQIIVGARDRMVWAAWRDGEQFVLQRLQDAYGMTAGQVRQIGTGDEPAAPKESRRELAVPAGDLARLAEQPPDGLTQQERDEWLPDSAWDLIEKGIPAATLKAYVQQMRWYRPWCEDQQRTWLPSSQNTMITYIDSWRERPIHVRCHCRKHRPSPSMLWVWYSALRFFHGIGDPPVPWEGGMRLQKAMAGYGSEMVDLGWEPFKAPRLYPHEVRAMVDAAMAAPEEDPEKKLKAWQVVPPQRKLFMRALVLTGYYTGGRASDAATFRISGIERFPDRMVDGQLFPGGIQLALQASKTNKRKGRKVEYRTIHRDREDPRYDGVAALDAHVAHLADLGVTQGAIFRPLHKSGTLVRGAPDALGYRMDVTALSRVVRHAARLAGLPNWQDVSFHCLRRGRASALRETGADTWDIENELGWAHGGAASEYFEEVARQSPQAANAKAML